jgi:2-polyprenyl-3-methyl-5-hydroxy-6-metoxy-1,4-benzoquinol methylase
MTTDAALRHFELVGPSYTQRRHAWPLGAFRAEEQQAVRTLARVEAGARILDAGCGDGETMAWLTSLGARAFGIDRARSMVKHCRRRGLSVSLQDMEQPALRASFDWVFCIGALEFTRQPELALRALAGCLRPGGRLVLLFPRRGWLTTVYAAYHRTHGVGIHVFSHDEVGALLLSTGVRPRSWRRCAIASVCLAERVD